MLPDEDLLTELLCQPSITPCDHGCMGIIEDFLKIKPTYFNRNNTCNAFYSVSSYPDLVFVGHTDVVSPGIEEHWQSSPFPDVVHDPVIARGIVDMKGAIWAFASALKANPRSNVALLLTSDEEGTGQDGLAYAIDCLRQKDTHIPWALVGEPTSHETLGDYFKHERRGSYTLKVKIHGKQGHTAYPEYAKNPSHTLALLIGHLHEFNEQLPLNHNLEIFSITTSSHTSNIIPGYIELGMNIRYFDIAQVKRLTLLLQTFTNDLTHLPGATPYQSNPQGLKQQLVDAIFDVTGIESQSIISGGTSDARLLSPICSEIIEFGLRSQTAHQVNESSTQHDLITLRNIYSYFLSSLPKTHVSSAKKQKQAIIQKKKAENTMA